jgi:two-component system, response regulator RegA
VADNDADRLDPTRATVLVIDDDGAFAERLTAALRSDGWAVARATDGAAGGQLLRQHADPHAVVLEPNLAGAGWYQLLHLAARSACGARLLVITAFWSAALAEEAHAAGAAVCLHKPVPIENALAMVRAAAAPPRLPAATFPRRPTLARLEWEYINQAIRDCRGNMTRAARLLGIHRPSLYKKLRKHPPMR